MSSKNEPPKVLNVLERMGMVRKSDTAAQSEYEAAGDDDFVYTDKNETDFDVNTVAAVAEAAVNAVPEVKTESKTSVQEFFIPEYEPEPFVKVDPAWSESKQYSYTSENRSGVGESMNESSFWDDSPTVTTDTDRFMDVEEIYRALSIKTTGTDTIYLVEEYMKTLPDSLPAESRRSIIMKIVAASGFDFDKLLNDGIDRVTKLNEYAATFAQQTDKIVARHNSELDALEKQIQRVRELIGERKNLHKRQFLTIETEAQRLKEVLDFITK